MKAHLNVVGAIDLVTGVFFTVLAALVSVGSLLAPWFYGAEPWRSEDAIVVYAVVLLITAVFLVIGIPSLIAGIGLLKGKGWARTLGMIVAVLALVSFPVGTAAGIYTLWC